MKRKLLGGIGVSLGLLWLASCTPYQQQAGVVGGIAGAAAGAVFGDDHQDVIAGAAAGAAVGAGAAAVHENHTRQRDYARYGIPPSSSASSGSTRSSSPSSSSPEPSGSEYPTAQRTENPDEVLSPYAPHHRINVAGFKSGQLARDPKNQKIFRIP
ncbi:MAG: hypothetical protein ACQKBU_07085 [Verrucomicrobiales bacterium]